jgi:hypothetical protein
VGSFDDVFWGSKVGLPYFKVNGTRISPGKLHDLAYARDGHRVGDRRCGHGIVTGSGSGLLRVQRASPSVYDASGHRRAEASKTSFLPEESRLPLVFLAWDSSHLSHLILLD